MKPDQRVAFMWPGLPDYGARLIAAFIKKGIAQVDVLATRPSVPIAGMEDSLGQKIHWLDSNSNVTWDGLDLTSPHIIFQGGWSERCFQNLSSHALKSGAKIILMNDQNWTGGFKQGIIDRLRFQFKNFDAMFVPGLSGVRYAKAMGFAPDKIATGLYGADPKVFSGGPQLTHRPKRFLFVGQLIARKNVLNLVRAFIKMSDDFPDWKLVICGSGELQKQIPHHNKIEMKGFLQPQALAEELRASRCLVLPSHEEHWGLVVHEAASFGCVLALSAKVGSADDFPHVEFSPSSENSIEQALRKIADFEDGDWRQAETASRASALKFGPEIFAASVRSLIGKVCT